jgi:hypothetical protein
VTPFDTTGSIAFSPGFCKPWPYGEAVGAG